MCSLSSRVLNLNFRLLSGHRYLINRNILPRCSPLLSDNVCLESGRSVSTYSVLFQSADNKSKQAVSFASLFRNSPLVQLGLPEGKVVQGNVVDVVGDDLYIDFGFKFNAVCRRPKLNSGSYVRGAIVKVRINDLELSDRFLGSNQDMTLLEADVTLLGLISTPVKAANTKLEN